MLTKKSIVFAHFSDTVKMLLAQLARRHGTLRVTARVVQAAPSSSVHFIKFHCLQQKDSKRNVSLRLTLATENYLVISDRQQKSLDSVPKDKTFFLQSIANNTG